MSTCMKINKVSFAYGEKQVLRELDFSIKKGKITTILGQNGSGKSTLFKLLTKAFKTKEGKIELNEKPIEQIRKKEFAKLVAVVNQYNTAPADITVRELVAYGRTPYQGFCGCVANDKQEDERAIQWALEVCGLEEIKDCCLSNLSGGQQQRVWIAMALAQKTEILFLDEPTTYLDVHYQIELLKLIKELNRTYQITVVMILHDINQAVHYSDEIVALKEGHILAKGTPSDIITKETIKRLYDVELNMLTHQEKQYVLAV